MTAVAKKQDGWTDVGAPAGLASPAPGGVASALPLLRRAVDLLEGEGLGEPRVAELEEAIRGLCRIADRLRLEPAGDGRWMPRPPTRGDPPEPG